MNAQKSRIIRVCHVHRLTVSHLSLATSNMSIRFRPLVPRGDEPPFLPDVVRSEEDALLPPPPPPPPSPPFAMMLVQFAIPSPPL